MRKDVRLLGLELGDSSPDFFDTRRIAEFIRSAKECFPEQLVALEERLRSRDLTPQSAQRGAAERRAIGLYPAARVSRPVPIIGTSRSRPSGSWSGSRSSRAAGCRRARSRSWVTRAASPGTCSRGAWSAAFSARSSGGSPKSSRAIRARASATLLERRRPARRTHLVRRLHRRRDRRAPGGARVRPAAARHVERRRAGARGEPRRSAGSAASSSATTTAGRPTCRGRSRSPNGTPPTTERVHPTMLYETLLADPRVRVAVVPARPLAVPVRRVAGAVGARPALDRALPGQPAAIGPFSNAQLVALVCIAAGAASWLWFYDALRRRSARPRRSELGRERRARARPACWSESSTLAASADSTREALCRQSAGELDSPLRQRAE